MKIVTLDRRRVAARRFGEEIAIVDLRGRTVHRLNATAARLWSVLASGGQYADLVRELCVTYEVDDDVAARDVEAFLATLVDVGLARVEPALPAEGAA